MTLPLNSELIARARKVAGECSVIETRTLLRALATALEQQSPVEPKDASDVVGRLRAEIEFQQGDAAAWGVDTYGDLPRNLAVMSEAAGLIASLQAQVEALTRERDEADVGDGWKLVPVEPTLAMSLAGETQYTRSGLGIWSNFHAIYRAMIAAAPTSPEPSPAGGDVPTWKHNAPFITQVSQPDGKKFVSVAVRTFDALHDAHDLIITAFKDAGAK